MTAAGSALMGIGHASGENRAEEAAKAAVSSPMLESSIEGARGILLSIAGGSELTLHEVNAAAEAITRAAHPDANIIFGAVIDDSLGDECRITVIAAGFDKLGTGSSSLIDSVFEARPVDEFDSREEEEADDVPMPSILRDTGDDDLFQESDVPAEPARVVIDADAEDYGSEDLDIPDFLKR
jgi:cell division protein FtsZ